MRVDSYFCDRCGEAIKEDDLTKVSITYGKGRFDLRDEDFELCPLCAEAGVQWMQNKLED